LLQKKGVIVSEYTDQELLNLLEHQGEDIDEFRARARKATESSSRSAGTADERATLRQGTVRQGASREALSPVQIMSEAQAQGITIPRQKIGKFLICVVKGVMTKALPAAVRDCAKNLIGGQ
jgi:hypothetical protein